MITTDKAPDDAMLVRRSVQLRRTVIALVFVAVGIYLGFILIMAWR